MTREAWGKYDKEEDRFHPLSHHCMDVADDLRADLDELFAQSRAERKKVLLDRDRQYNPEATPTSLALASHRSNFALVGTPSVVAWIDWILGREGDEEDRSPAIFFEVPYAGRRFLVSADFVWPYDGIVSPGVVWERCTLRGFRRSGLGRSVSHCGQLYGVNVAHRSNGFECHVTGSLDSPFLIPGRRLRQVCHRLDGLTMIGDKEEFAAPANSRMMTVLQTK